VVRRSQFHVLRGRVLAVLGVLAVVAATLAAGPTIATARADGGGHDHAVKLRVATYNIHHGAGPDDVLDLEHVARVLASTRADIIGLQEVDRHWGERSNFLDEAQWLADRLDRYAVYGANLDLDPLEPGQERRQYGTAILSKFPILDWSNTHLPKFGDHEQRGLLVATIKARGVKVRFANTHLQHNDNLEREAQAARIVELLGADPERTFVVGDLNATSETPEITTLTNVYTDTWAKVGVGDGFSYPAEDPHARIDYVLSSPDVTPLRARVVPTDASDHLPVVVDVTVRR
jgi:endonuclease/exonuclease/phosphatase family metal-dependent hydrolase